MRGRRLSVGIVGAGLMGHGIAQAFAVAGAKVCVFDSSPEASGSLRLRVVSNLLELGLPLDLVEAIDPVDSISAAVASADLIIEAAPENLELKRGIFAELAEVADGDAILASATSVISIGEIASGQAAANRIIGTHWWNPPYLVPLVEVIEAETTSKEAVERTIAILRAVGKAPVHVRRDLPGFVGNRLQHSLRREALALVDAGVCSPADVDLVARQVLAPRLTAHGLIAHADLVGLDLTEAIHAYLLPHLDASTEPAQGLLERVGRGDLGAKTGRGYLEWEN